MTTAQQFEDEFVKLISREMVNARKDDERAAALIQLLASSLGKIIGLKSEGNAKLAEIQLQVAENHMAEEAARMSGISVTLASTFARTDKSGEKK